MIRQRKKEYIQSSFDNFRDLKSFHRQLNLITGKNTDAVYPSFTETTNIDTFNEFNVNVGPNMHEVIPTENPINLKRSEVQSMFLEPTNEAELASVMNKLKNKTSTGPYGISNKLLKLAAPAIVAPLNTLINRCFSESYFPDILKLAKMIPVYKNDDPNDFSNYRPISLVSPIGKLVEIVLYNRMINYINKFDLLHQNQFGFRKKHKTVDALACVIEQLRRAIDDKKPACCIFPDLSKAFDSIHHDILLSKLYNYGFRGPVHHLLKSYLTNRSQYVQIGSCRSELKQVICGVPQGSVVGLLVFILYVKRFS